MTLDISETLAANSNQLNAADIMGVEPIVQIKHVSKANDPKQPIVIEITGGFKPFLPCKTVRRILAEAWGADAGQWIGRWMQLYREPSVVYAGEEVGGVRLRALSDISGGMTVKLKERKTGKPNEYKITKLTPPKPEAMTLDAFRGWISHAMKNGWTQEQVQELIGAGRKAADVPEEMRAEVVERLKEAPGGGAK